MDNLLKLFLSHIDTVSTIMKLVEQGIEIAPEIIRGAEAEFTTITSFWSQGRDPTDGEMDDITNQRKSLEDAILSVKP